MGECLEALNKDIIVKKQGKFIQDKLAFSEGYAYKWTGRQHPKRNTVRNRRPQETTTVTDLTESDSSIPSLSSQATSRPLNSCTPGIPHKRSPTGEGHPSKDPKKGKKHGKISKAQQPPRSGVKTPQDGALQPTLHKIIPKLLQPNTKTLLPHSVFLVQMTPEPTRQGSLDAFLLKTPMPATSPNLLM